MTMKVRIDYRWKDNNSGRKQNDFQIVTNAKSLSYACRIFYNDWISEDLGYEILTTSANYIDDVFQPVKWRTKNWK